ncbi:MAG: GNAT family N-acetyltransferase [Methylococcales bacterium]|nr:GNAT family N-acetyltransferase [Methylococcales bacterium]
MTAILNIRQMLFQEMPFAINAARLEGWNPGLYDADAFYHADPNGFFIAEVAGKLIGSISGVAYNDDYGFIGLFIIDPEYRGQWHGIQLGKVVLEYLGERNVGLDGVLEKQIAYQNYFGFNYAYKNIRFEGKAKSKKPPTSLPIADVDFNKLLEYDREIFLVPRTEFLRRWIAQVDSVGYYSENETHLVGYGILRKCVTGYKIGPLFADNEAIAVEILEALLSNIPGEVYYLDIPEPNLESLKIAEQFNMQKVFETARMYSKEIPNVPLHKVFGITSFELG